MKKVISLYIITILCMSATAGFAQMNNGLLTSLTSIAGMREKFPIEKLYLQLDKPYYTLGDTLRFKAYLFNADFLKPSLRSGLLYIEVDDSNNRCVKRIMAPVASGISWGDMALDEKEFPEGSYTLRAYTNWMLNFGEDYVFKQNIYISALSGSTLVKADFKADNTKISASLRFNGLDKNPLRLKDMQLKVMSGKHTFLTDKATTGMDGTMNFTFDLADKAAKNLIIHADENGQGADTAKLVIPVIINRPGNTDLQFMPEGGNLVAGIPTRLGFKAISEDGKGLPVTGKIYNSKQQEVITFKATHKGMGSFELTPQAGESYTAKIVSPGGIAKSYPLPVVNATGTTLTIDKRGKDSLTITLNASADLSNTNYYLIAQTRALICYTALFNFKGSPIKKTIAKSLFPNGIAHFTLLSSANQPLNERIIYIDQNNNLKINLTASKLNYTIRDSIAVAISIKDNAGKPVRGNFSLAVTDDSQVRTDTTGNNIATNMFLISDLKGTIEEPGYYFENITPQKETELDNLLLTQGWVGYDWKAIFNPVIPEPKYAAEREFMVQGKVTNMLNKPVEGSNVVLFARRTANVFQSVTDKEGRFTFKGFVPVDTAAFKIQARNKNGQSFNVGIEMMNEFKPPVFAATTIQQAPWYVNSDTILINNTHIKAAQQQAQANYRGEGHMLKEVTIKDKKIVKGSKNLNGPGMADEILDEQDMLKAGKMSLRQLLEQKIKGLTVAKSPDKGGNDIPRGNSPYRLSYKIFDKELRLVFDGVDIDYFYVIPDVYWLQRITDRKQFMDTYLDYYSAEDITGIEVMYNVSYNQTYAFKMKGDFGVGSPAYIEITTRSGKGPYMKLTPGTYLYKPLPFTLPKDFYRPRYTVKNNAIAMGTDLRSTIHWEPRVVTDKDGKAIVTFFSADKPANYTLILEGTDMNGNMGYARQKVKVSKAAPVK